MVQKIRIIINILVILSVGFNKIDTEYGTIANYETSPTFKFN